MGKNGPGHTSVAIGTTSEDWIYNHRPQKTSVSKLGSPWLTISQLPIYRRILIEVQEP
jgi:hypothetical protein